MVLVGVRISLLSSCLVVSLLACSEPGAEAPTDVSEGPDASLVDAADGASEGDSEPSTLPRWQAGRACAAQVAGFVSEQATAAEPDA